MDSNFFSTTRLLDGGMGQELLARGMQPKGTLWSAVALQDPDLHHLVYQTHLDFIAAGSDVIVTNTFTTRRLRLRENHVEDQFVQLNTIAGEIASKAKRMHPQVMVAGGLPPQYATYAADPRPEEEITANFYDQASVLTPFVDFFYLDVLNSLKSIQCAINVSRRLDKPFLVGVHISQGCHLPSGESLSEVLPLLNSADCLGVILSCVSPENFSHNVTALQSSTLPFGFKLNGFITTKVEAGYEQSMKVHRGQNPLKVLGKREDLSPPIFYNWAKQFHEQGATILGGCCETGPEHIHALAPLKG
ncbi:MAG: homocysteine S-methyltransferase [Coxiellaceae bacterium]|nr:homocysteine S-methyltransferase [Coxiellaceae bacterium]|tara:strand:+ start:150 stop:1061 length:912 start_codon:yes stop_codon:yes gene_type:complete